MRRCSFWMIRRFLKPPLTRSTLALGTLENAGRPVTCIDLRRHNDAQLRAFTRDLRRSFASPAEWTCQRALKPPSTLKCRQQHLYTCRVCVRGALTLTSRRAASIAWELICIAVKQLKAYKIWGSPPHLSLLIAADASCSHWLLACALGLGLRPWGDAAGVAHLEETGTLSIGNVSSKPILSHTSSNGISVPKSWLPGLT